MRIIPAVDIRGGLCVNLVQGDYDQETVFSGDPIVQAELWRQSGGGLIHIVDLDGAKAGHLCVGAYLRSLSERGIPFEVGGGIRTMDTIRAVFEAGAERVILGTAAYRDPALLCEATLAYPGRIVVGIDAKAGMVALQGWVEVTGADAVAFAQAVEKAGAARLIHTDILSDGMMKGPNLDATRAVAQAVEIPVTASGGMSSLEDVRRIRELESDGVDEVIIGRALYLGAFTLQEAVAVAQEPT